MATYDWAAKIVEHAVVLSKPIYYTLRQIAFDCWEHFPFIHLSFFFLVWQSLRTWDMINESLQGKRQSPIFQVAICSFFASSNKIII